MEFGVWKATLAAVTLGVVGVAIGIGHLDGPTRHHQHPGNIGWLKPTDLHREVTRMDLGAYRAVLDPAVDSEKRILRGNRECGDVLGLSGRNDSPAWRLIRPLLSSWTVPSQLNNPASGAALVLDFKRDELLLSLADSPNIAGNRMQSGTLGLIKSVKVVLSDLSLAASLAERRPNKPYADRAKGHADHGRHAHNRGPERHFLLRYKIQLAAFIFAALGAAFLVCLAYAFHLIEAGEGETGAGYLFAGVFGIIGNAVLGFLVIGDLLTQTI